MAFRNLLVVTGNYDIVQQIRQGLGDVEFAIHTAYSHLDVLYRLKYELFEVILIDAAMVNRNTGDHTAVTLARLPQHPPLLIYAPPPLEPEDDWSGETVVTDLDVETLRAGVARALRLPTLPGLSREPAAEQAAPPVGVHTSIFWRDEEIQTLFALARSLTEVLDLTEVLNRIVAAARHLTNAEEGMILLPDGQSGQLYLRAKVGIDLEVADNFRIKTRDTIAGTVFQTGQPLLLAASGPQKVKTEYFVNSLLYVPIIHKGQTLGVLGVNNKQKHDIFTERHRDLLMNLASYAAVAIENARVHGQSIRRTYELKALIDASQAINASLSFDRTLPAICDQFIRVLNVGYSEVYRWNDREQRLDLLAWSQQAHWRSGFEPTIELAERPVIRHALSNRRHVMIWGDRHDIPVEREYLARVGARAMLVLPVLGGDQVIGAIQAYYVQSPHDAPPAEAVFLAQRIVLEALAALSSENDFAYSFKPLNDACVALEADWIEFALLSPDGSALTRSLAAGKAVWSAELAPYIDVTASRALLEALEREPLNFYVGEDDLPPSIQALFALRGSRSLLALPLIIRGQMQGFVLFADTLHARAFSPREIDLGRAIVGQAATALENVNLVRDLEASVRELKDTQNRLIQTARLSAMGELAAAVAHQINNPLTTIVLDTELLLEKVPQDAETTEALNAISRSGKRAAGVVRRLLAMARPTTTDIPRSAVDVIYTIEEIITLIRPHIEREGIRLLVQLPQTSLPPVRAVPGELDDVWLNLILNAHDVLVGVPHAEIGVAAGYDYVSGIIEITVWDNGPGIPEEIVGEIFKPFFTTKPIGEGTGLGLHICRQVVDRVGGVITVTTSSEGTQFKVRLPIMRST